MDIPLDVVDLVLGTLAPQDEEWERVGYDPARPKESLSSCSRVCRSWYSLSRRHLFRDVIYSFVSIEETSWKTTKFGEDGRWRTFFSDDNPDDLTVKQPCKTLQMFIQFLGDQPDLASHIRHLSLRYFPSSWYHSGTYPEQLQFRFDDDERHIPQSLVYTLLYALPNLQSLRLRDVFLQHKDYEVESETFPHPLVSLDLLSISYPLATFCQQRHLILRVINNCASTRRLQLAVPGAEPVTMAQGRISRIDELVLYYIPCKTGIPRHLLGLHVTSLTIIAEHGEDVRSYNEYFREMGHTLKELRIKLSDFQTDPGESTFDLSPCVNLESFAISTPFWAQFHYIDEYATRLVTHLSHTMFALTKLRDFKIHYHFYTTFFDVAPDNDQVESFARSVSAADTGLVALVEQLNLTTIHITPHIDPRMEGWVHWFLRKVFGGLDERELLRFVDEDDDWKIDRAAHRQLPDTIP